MIRDYETGGMTSCRVCSSALQLLCHSPSLCIGWVNYHPLLASSVQAAAPCCQDMYRLASCEGQTQAHKKCSPEGAAKHYTYKGYLTVQQL